MQVDKGQKSARDEDNNHEGARIRVHEHGGSCVEHNLIQLKNFNIGQNFSWLWHKVSFAYKDIIYQDMPD